MSDDTTTLQTELVDGEGFMQPRRVRVTYQCTKCRQTYTRVCKAVPRRDPPCPNKQCGEADRIAALERQIVNLTSMLAEQRAPAQIGQNVRTKAIDLTAEVAMANHGLTNLKDNIREGETMAPKLAPAAQAAADAYFASGAATAASVQARGGAKPMSERDKTRLSNAMKRWGAKAIAGDYRGGALAPTEVITQKPTIHTLADDKNARRVN